MMPVAAEELVSGPPALFGPRDARRALAGEAEDQVARALTIVNRARALVAADRSHCIDLLTARRGALCAHLLRYQRFKHGRIFDPVVRLGLPSSQVVARTMKVDCLAMGEEVAAYHARWLRVHATEWQAYRADMIATTDRLALHLAAELRAIRQLIMIGDLYDL